MISITRDFADQEVVRALFARFSYNKFKSVMKLASKAAIKNANRYVTAGIQSHFALIRELKEKHIASKATDFAASVSIRGGRLPLHYFKHSPTSNQGRQHLKVEVEKGITRNYHPAFLIDGWGIFRRRGEFRLPISKLSGPSEPEMTAKTEVRQMILNKMLLQYNEELMRHL